MSLEPALRERVNRIVALVREYDLAAAEVDSAEGVLAAAREKRDRALLEIDRLMGPRLAAAAPTAPDASSAARLPLPTPTPKVAAPAPPVQPSPAPLALAPLLRAASKETGPAPTRPFSRERGSVGGGRLAVVVDLFRRQPSVEFSTTHLLGLVGGSRQSLIGGLQRMVAAGMASRGATASFWRAGPALCGPEALAEPPDPAEETAALEPPAPETDESHDDATPAPSPRDFPEIGNDEIRMVKMTLARVISRAGGPNGPLEPHRDDLYSEGMKALAEARERFDASKGVPFRGYAHQRVQGAMQDFCRRLDLASREQRRALREGDETIEERKRVDLSAAATVAAESLDPAEELDRLRKLQRVEEAVKELPAKLRQVYRMRVTEGQALLEVARHFQVTEARACQLYQEMVRRLRLLVEELPPPPDPSSRGPTNVHTF